MFFSKMHRMSSKMSSKQQKHTIKSDFCLQQMWCRQVLLLFWTKLSTSRFTYGIAYIHFTKYWYSCTIAQDIYLKRTTCNTYFLVTCLQQIPFKRNKNSICTIYIKIQERNKTDLNSVYNIGLTSPVVKIFRGND